MGASSRFLLTIVQRLLNGHEVDSAGLARGAPFKPAAVRGMLDDITEVLGLHVFVRGKHPRRYRLRRPTDLTSDPFEAVAMALAREVAVFLKDSLIDQHLQHAASTAAARLDPKLGAAVPDLSRMILTKTRLGAPQVVVPEAVDVVVQSLLDGRPVKGRYRQFNGSEQSVTVHAYSLILSEEGLYIYGRCLEAEKVDHVDTLREYNVARFAGLHPEGERRAYPSLADYNPTTLFEHCWGIFVPPPGEQVVPATIAFSEKFFAFLTYHRYHRHQGAPALQEDGTIEVTFDVYLTQDFMRFIRCFGREARPVGPERLVRWYEDGRDPEHPEKWG